MFHNRMRDGKWHGRNIWRGDEEQVKDWLKKRKRDMRREFSVFLVLVLALTGNSFSCTGRKRAGHSVRRMEGGLRLVCSVL